MSGTSLRFLRVLFFGKQGNAFDPSQEGEIYGPVRRTEAQIREGLGESFAVGYVRLVTGFPLDRSTVASCDAGLHNSAIPVKPAHLPFRPAL
jgi:hypothetical protein